MGKTYFLKVSIDTGIKRPNVEIEDSRIKVYSPSEGKKEIKDALRRWYRGKAQQVIEDRIKGLLEFSEKRPSVLKAKEQKKRWGSCTHHSRIYINWRIVMTPPAIIDYVLAHELSHLYYRDHSVEFWEKVSTFIPDYKKRRNWLRKNSVKIEL